MAEDSTDDLKETPLTPLHRALGARMAPFAGYLMPISYEGILAEHVWTRQNAGLFDVSHMGQRFLAGPDHETTAAALEAVTPGSFRTMAPGQVRYTLFLDEAGGILDDLMVTRSASSGDDGTLYLVVNAARKEADDAFLREHLPAGVRLLTADDRALLALQGPAAEAVMRRHCPKAADLGFMQAGSAEFDGIDCHVSRSGYTGEDGFEISIPVDAAERVARALLDEPEVKPIGLGARDTLRLEAGLPLYGHDIDETTSPVEAGLSFAIPRSRRERADFPGAERILREIADGPARRRVGLRPHGRAPVREGAAILDENDAPVGAVTSGGFGPSVGGPIAMGYVESRLAASGIAVKLQGRRGAEPADIAALPLVPTRYKRTKP